MLEYLFIAFIVIICIQCIYYLIIFGNFSFSNNSAEKNNFTHPVSVIICAKNEADNLIENKGISKAIEKANSADLVIVLTEDGEIPIEIENSSVLKFVSKCDDGELADGVSAFTGYGLDNMISSIKRKLEKRVQNQGLATRYRHREAIDSAVNKIQMAKKFVKDGPSFYDLAAEELRQTTYTLDELFGKVDVENVLDEIFSSFCLGK